MKTTRLLRKGLWTTAVLALAASLTAGAAATSELRVELHNPQAWDAPGLQNTYPDDCGGYAPGPDEVVWHFVANRLEDPHPQVWAAVLHWPAEGVLLAVDGSERARIVGTPSVAHFYVVTSKEATLTAPDQVWVTGNVLGEGSKLLLSHVCYPPGNGTTTTVPDTTTTVPDTTTTVPDTTTTVPDTTTTVPDTTTTTVPDEVGGVVETPPAAPHPDVEPATLPVTGASALLTAALAAALLAAGAGLTAAGRRTDHGTS